MTGAGSSDSAHRTVLLDEAVDALAVRGDGTYLDATFGRGGHSQAILDRLGDGGRLLAIDRDPEAVATAHALFGDRSNFTIYRASFADLAAAVAAMGADGLDGVLMDLGVSSPQLDDAARGFSFLRDGPLDMRMDPEHGPSAAEWINAAEEAEIADVLYEYGEERQSRRIARAVVRARSESRIEGTLQLASLIESVLGRPHGAAGAKHPATRSFQAIRIHVNDELAALDAALEAAVDRLLPGGRLVVISFHSLEDRRVKRFIRAESTPAAGNRRLPMAEEQPLRLRRVGGAVRPGDDETNTNPRARSAIMRVAEKNA